MSCLRLNWNNIQNKSEAIKLLAEAVAMAINSSLPVRAFDTMFVKQTSEHSICFENDHNNEKYDANITCYPILYSDPHGTGVRPHHFFDKNVIPIELMDDIFRLRFPNRINPEIFEHMRTEVIRVAYELRAWHPPMISWF